MFSVQSYDFQSSFDGLHVECQCTLSVVLLILIQRLIEEKLQSFDAAARVVRRATHLTTEVALDG